MSDRLIKVGVVTSCHGVKGLVKVRSFAERPFELFSSTKISDEKGAEIVFDAKFLKGDDAIIACINGISRKEDAEALRGLSLYVKRSDLPELLEEEFYHEDLIGLKVLYENGDVAGIVKSVTNFGASDLLEIHSDSSDFLYPFHKNFIIDVNMNDRIITVKKLEDI